MRNQFKKRFDKRNLRYASLFQFISISFQEMRESIEKLNSGNEKNQTNDASLKNKSLSLFPEPYPWKQEISNYEDPNRSCTWLLYGSAEFQSVDVGGLDYLDEARKTCVKLGKNECNAVIEDTSDCSLIAGTCGERTWRPSFIVGEPKINAGIVFKYFIENEIRFFA